MLIVVKEDSEIRVASLGHHLQNYISFCFVLGSLRIILKDTFRHIFVMVSSGLRKMAYVIM